MSRTDKTRPFHIIDEDPTMNRFRCVGILRYRGSSFVNEQKEIFWKKVYSCACWACSQKKAFYKERKSARTTWRKGRQDILKSIRSGNNDVDPPTIYRY